MSRPYVTVILLIGLLLAALVLAGAAAQQRLPNDHQGYAPRQPMAYSHRLHAGELGIDCRYCHTAAEEGQHAGIPAADVCMRCHQYVTAPFADQQAELRRAEQEGRTPQRVISAELRKLYDYLALDDELQPRADRTPAPIPWVRVHNLPDFVAFDHRAHVNAGVSCQHCHGPIESMQTVAQHASLSMGWCVNCHRDAQAHGIAGKPVQPSNDCAACHY